MPRPATVWWNKQRGAWCTAKNIFKRLVLPTVSVCHCDWSATAQAVYRTASLGVERTTANYSRIWRSLPNFAPEVKDWNAARPSSSQWP